MANNNVQNIMFLRNGSVFAPSGSKTAREVALEAMNTQLSNLQDGTAILGRYKENGSTDTIKTLVGFAYVNGGTRTLTVFDTEGASGDVEKLRQEINAKLGDGITSENTATAQLTALSGKSTDASGVTSVWGAKAYADAKISDLDYTDTAVTGSYVSKVTQADGKIAVTRVALPTVQPISEAGQPITAVSESLGTISATAGTINAEYVNIADSGNKFSATTVEGALAEVANKIDAMDKTASAENGKVVTTVSEENGVVSETKASVKDLQLGGYSKTTATGDIATNDTINVALSKLENKAAAITITNDDKSINVTTGASGTNINVNIKDNETVIKKDGNGGIYTNLGLVKITDATLPAETKVRYELRDSNNTKIGESIDIPKDSHIVEIKYITDSGDTHYQNLEYVYVDVSGNTKTAYVDISSLVLEAEFASGTTVENHVVRGVVDSTSESFLTVGKGGFKLSGVQDAIDNAVSDLDATVGSTDIAAGKHVAVQVIEKDGKLTGLTVTEGNIANATDLADLSGKTVTSIKSTNSSINISTANTADETVEVNVITDADKIKMSGFSADSKSSLSGIVESDSIATAFEKTNEVITKNEETVASALVDLDNRLDVIESGYVETVKVNNVALAETDNAVNVQISSVAASGTSTSPIVVNTDTNGAVTLQIQYLDCGTYN